ncbi:alpha/beta fold hydrolase [Aspergillus ibericus CBS 121593]|uniref:AB hydrolase-1 domain-containing protein n=1 Tax=Aspergillus ibericus CBS 121593 TaxID=1448316 RepID=A0A395GKN3_9EURO|nr:hypothetical protein BO80DRAFT_367505 [Aspergillus ibericus CBS 121593]RAK95954.1 hypothetical protein BO80DRAFT_367505 [Aspergillus ibericus CBS 121593]
MRSALLVTAALSLQGAAVASVFQDLSQGFLDPYFSVSSNGSAICVSGLIAVPVNATNTKLLLAEPVNQTQVTEIIQENFQASSTLSTTTDGGSLQINAVYNIDATLCVPAAAPSTSTIQVLTHGVGLDKSYWDIAADYSYVDAAASAGHATLAYNRLGVGQSSHPDAIQVVQAPVDVSVLHGLTTLLRTGHVGSHAYATVIGTGHSYGSIVQLAQNVNFPSDVNATILTGFTTTFTYLPYTVFANNPAIARQADPARFGNLSNGYLVTDTRISFQLPFFRSPYFDPKIFELQFQARNTYTVGQQLTLSGIYAVASSYRGPVAVVAGEYDFAFGGGAVTESLLASTLETLYPEAAAGSTSYVVPNSGHVINAHYSAQQQFSQINAFLECNGF